MREEKQHSVASHMPPAGDLAHNPGMCPDRESNQRHFSSHTSVQSTEPHQLSYCTSFNFVFISVVMLLFSSIFFFWVLLIVFVIPVTVWSNHY